MTTRKVYTAEFKLRSSNSLRVVYRSQLSPEEYAKLLEVLEIQALDGAVLRAEAAGALAAGRSAEVAADLRTRLAEF